MDNKQKSNKKNTVKKSRNTFTPIKQTKHEIPVGRFFLGVLVIAFSFFLIAKLFKGPAKEPFVAEHLKKIEYIKLPPKEYQLKTN